MEAILGMQILDRFRSKRKFNEDVEELEESFKASDGDANEVIFPLLLRLLLKFVKKGAKYTQETKQVS